MMALKVMSRQEIIMNFSHPPTGDDIAGIAGQVIDSLPVELVGKCEKIILEIEEFPDDALQQDMDLSSPYELLALFHAANEIAPGVQKKVANGEDKIVLYRRPILDVWAETGEDFSQLVREIVLEELGRGFELSEDDINEMVSRYHL